MTLSPVSMSIVSFDPRTTFFPCVKMTSPPSTTWFSLTLKSAQSPVAFCPFLEVTITSPRASMRVISAGSFLVAGGVLFGEPGGAGIEGAQLGSADDEVALHGAHVALEDGLLGAIVDVETPCLDVDGCRRVGLEHAHRTGCRGFGGFVGELLHLLLGGLRFLLLAAIEAGRDASRLLTGGGGRKLRAARRAFDEQPLALQLVATLDGDDASGQQNGIGLLIDRRPVAGGPAVGAGSHLDIAVDHRHLA